MGLRLKYEDIDCTSTDDMRSRVEELTENGTKNLYIIVNYSGLYRTNRMLKELAQNTKGQPCGSRKEVLPCENDTTHRTAAG